MLIDTEYENSGIKCDVDHEIIANFVGEKLLGGMAGNIVNENGELVCNDVEIAAIIEKFAREKPTWFDSIIDHIQNLIAKKRMVMCKTSGRNVEVELKQMHRFLAEMKKDVDKQRAKEAKKNAKAEQKNTAEKSSGERQYDIVVLDNGNTYV